MLAKGREVKYAKEMQSVVDRALEEIGGKTGGSLDSPGGTMRSLSPLCTFVSFVVMKCKC